MDMLRSAIVGCGNISNGHLGAIKQLDGVRLVAAIDLDTARAERVAAEHGATAFRTLAEAAEQCEFDAVHVCLPHYLNQTVALEALKAGYHVLVEKPMALTLDNARQLVDTAERVGVTLMAGHVLRYREHFRKARAIIQSGAIGEPVHTLRRRQMYSPSSPGVPWSADPTKTGGWLLYGFGPHEFDMALWLMGRKPLSVAAFGARVNPHWQGIDEISAQVRLEGGANATVIMGLNWRDRAWDQEVIGTEGFLSVNEKSLRVNGEEVPFDPSPLDGFLAEVAEFVKAIKEGRTPETSGQRVLPTMAVLEAVKASVESGAPVAVGL